MTHTFHLYYDGIEVAEPEIYRSEIERYAADSKKSLADRKQRISDAIHRAYETMRSLKPERLGHVFLVLALPLAAHAFA
jgi:hypothetical protein